MADQQPAITQPISAAPVGPDVDLTRPEILERFQEYVRYILTFDDAELAYRLVRGLEAELGDPAAGLPAGHALAPGYWRVLNLGRGICLPQLEPAEVVAYCREGVAEALRETDLPLMDKFSAVTVKLLFLEERDALKKQLLAALKQNQERLTEDFLLAAGRSALAPTVAEWLRQAEQERQGGDPLLRAIIRNENFRNLTRDKRQWVERLLVLADYLEIPATSAAGIDEPITIRDDDGKLLVLEGETVREAIDDETRASFQRYFPGKAQPRPSVAAVPIKEQVLTAYLKDQQRRADIAAAMEKLAAETGNDAAKLRDKMFGAIKNNAGNDVLAGFFQLAKVRALAGLLNDQRFQNLHVKNVLPKFADGGITGASPAPQQLGAFLRFFIDRAVADDDLSAQFGAQLASLLVAAGERDYLGLAVFSTKSGRYEWRL